MADDVVWYLRTNLYWEWSKQERTNLEEFLRACGIEPTHVLIEGGNEITVRILTDGSFLLSTWVSEHDETGRVLLCPHCPACVKQRKVEVPMTTSLPMVPGAYIPETVTVGDSTP